MKLLLRFCNTMKLKSLYVYRNYAIAHYMNDHSCFPEGTNLREACDLYFQFCSIMMNTSQGSLLAASLANGGVCPLTDERIFADSAVRDALSIMHSCGMYNYSGTYAFEVGLPSKSGELLLSQSF